MEKIYVYYVILIIIFIGLYHLDYIKIFLFNLIFNIGEFFCNNIIARHLVILIGTTLFNLGNASIFFAISGFFVSILKYPNSSVLNFTIYGIIMTIVGYIISRCQKI